MAVVPARPSAVPAKPSAVCVFCGNGIVRELTHWMTPIGEPVPAEVALPIECPGRRLHNTTFGGHAPS